MRKKILLTLFASGVTWLVSGQDSLKTVVLNEVVTVGTRFELPVEKSGKTIYKLTAEDLEKNAGKSLADVLNEVPGIQVDGNFGAPGTNVSYFVRGARNKSTLILIDGVPLNDPSAINAEYDLRYIPLSQIESVEVLKGGLSTLYGTGAAAAVINIHLKTAAHDPFKVSADLNVASYNTFSQALQVSGTQDKFSYMVMGNNISSTGFSAAKKESAGTNFDNDGFERRNVLAKVGYKVSKRATIGFSTAYEKFKADYDAFEFTDAANAQDYHQFRFGLNSGLTYGKGEIESKVVYNVNNRTFEGSFPSEYQGRNLQAEVTQRHFFSNTIQGLFGVNYQYMAFDQKEAISLDSAHINMVDPYASLLVDLPVGLSLHAGVRLNTHSLYGSKLVYNVNPSFLLNKDGNLNYKILASISTSYITPSLYQLYSFYGNKNLSPEEALNYEIGMALYNKKKFTFNFTWFRREETNPIDFVSLRYENLVSERTVYGVEASVNYTINSWVTTALNYAHNDTDVPASFYRIPKDKAGATVTLQPLPEALVSITYTFTGDRTTSYYNSNTNMVEKILLDQYQLIDLFASYKFLKNKFTVYGAINNILDEQFIAIYGYTTRGRNFSLGMRVDF